MSDLTAKRLDDLRLTEVSGVDHPAHLEEGWLVLKSQRPNQEAQPMEPINKEALDPEVRAYIETLESEVAVAKAAAEEATNTKTESEEESLEKALASVPEPVRKALEDAQARAAAAEAAVLKAQDDQLTAEYVEKAQALDHLSVNPQEFGGLLRKSAEVLGEDAVKLYDVLKAANDMVAQAKVMEEAGSTRTISGDAYAQIESLAKARSTEAGISLPEAMAAVASENPDLYSQYLNESRKGA